MTSAAFHQAKQRHEAISMWLRQNESWHTPDVREDLEARAAGVWDAIVGVDSSPAADSPGECVLDTRPESLRALLVENEPAAAVAWGMLEAVYVSSADIKPRALRDLARRAWARFGERADAVETMAHGFGWDLSESWQVWRDVEQAGDAAAVERIAKLAGRFVVALKGAVASRVTGAVGDLHSVEQGANLSRMLPGERMLMADEITESVFFDRLESRRLLQYSVRGRAPAPRGPIVLCLDESGSMHGARNDWAKAATLAIAQVAKAERRAIGIVHFATSAVEHPLNPSSPADVLRTIRSFLTGGTSIGLSLERALEMVKAMAAKGDKGADVILATDGIDMQSERVAAAVDALLAYGARLWTVGIEVTIPETSPLRARATSYVQLGAASLTDPASVVAIKGAV